MTSFAVFGITNGTVSLVVDLVILFLVVIWLALVYWTYSDARRRIADPMLVGCATAAALFPFVGSIVYMIVRPPEYLDDVHERELEIAAAEARLSDLGVHTCPYCDHLIEKDFVRCPHCMRKLKDPCASCGRRLDPSWKLCPFCEAEVGPTSAARRTRRPREGQVEAGIGRSFEERSTSTRPAERPGASRQSERPTAAPTERPVATSTERPIATSTERPIAAPRERPIAAPRERPQGGSAERPLTGPGERRVATQPPTDLV